MSDGKRCGVMFGARKKCRRFAGHKGRHSMKLAPFELLKLLEERS